MPFEEAWEIVLHRRKLNFTENGILKILVKFAFDAQHWPGQ